MIEFIKSLFRASCETRPSISSREAAFAGGDACRFYGGTRDENPYDPATEASWHDYWNQGWDQRDEEFKTDGQSQGEK